MDLERALQPPAGDALRWVQPALLHVTVSFFAEVEDHQLEPLQTALDEAAAGIHLALSLGPAGTFGGRSRVRALWLAVEAPGLEAQIARVGRAALVALGRPEVAADRPPAHPHLTLARVRDRAGPAARRAIVAAVEALAPPPRATLEVDAIALVRSRLGGGGPRHEVLSTHPRRSIIREERRNVDDLGDPH